MDLGGRVMEATMLARYGGLPVIAKVVLGFYDRVLAADRLKPFFSHADMRRIVDHQAKFIASVMGGPASFSGEYLHEAHAHLDIDDEAFDEMMRLLEATLLEARFAAEDIATIMVEMRAQRAYVVARSAG